MNLKAIANVLTSKVSRRMLVAQKHAPVILFAAGVVGVGATVVLACRATLKLDEVLEENRKKIELAHNLEGLYETDQERQQELAVLYVRTGVEVVKLYALPVALGVLSIAALTGSHYILTRRNIALMAAYKTLDEGFRRYRDRVAKQLGPDKERGFYHDLRDKEFAVDTDEGVVVKTMKRAHGISVYGICFDKTSTRWSPDPGYNQLFLQAQQNYLNNKLNATGHVFLNEVYDMLGYERTRAGAVVGWLKDSVDGDGFIDFGIFEGDMAGGWNFVMGDDKSVWLDFNVDGVIWDKI